MATESTNTTINLSNDVTVNGITYHAGQNVQVPKDQAEDIQRLDYDHNQYKNTLHVKRTFETNSGTIAVGGGAE